MLRRFAPILAVPFVLLAGCGDDETGAGLGGGAGPGAGECATNADCLLGELCEAGACVPSNDGSSSSSSSGAGSSSSSGAGSSSSSSSSGAGSSSGGGEGDANIEVDPPVLSFRYEAGAPGGQAPIVVFNGGGAELTVSRVDLWNEVGNDFAIVVAPALPTTIRPGRTVTFEINYTPGSGPGSALFVITSDDPDTPQLEVPISSRNKLEEPGAGADPCIELNPTRLDFGLVARGDTSVRSFEIRSCGRNPLGVSSIDRARVFGRSLSAEFQIVTPLAFPLTLNENDAVTVEVSYSPLRAGPDSGRFQIQNNTQTSPVDLRVSAIGTQPERGTQGFHVELEWDAETDVDMHVIDPAGDLWDCPLDCYFGNMEPDWGTPGDWTDDPFLDVDNVDGYGPENVNIQDPKPGHYRVVIHYYRDSQSSGGGSVPANATLRFYNNGTLVQTFGPERLADTNDTWEAFTVDWVDANTPPTLTPDGTHFRSPPSGGICGGLFP